jgi:hypothetical protein
VLLAAQELNHRPAYGYGAVHAPVVTRVVPAPSTVIITPAPRPYWHGHHYHHHHHHGHRSRFYYGVAF